MRFVGGTISGEHGIGYVQKQYMDIPFDPVQLELMKGSNVCSTRTEYSTQEDLSRCLILIVLLS